MEILEDIIPEEEASYPELRKKLIEFFHAEKEPIDEVSLYTIAEGSSITNVWYYRAPIVDRILDYVEVCSVIKFRVSYTIEGRIGPHNCSPWMLGPKHAPMTIWYHGTSSENAASIRKEGFREGTYFGQDLSDAVGHGGGHVFEVTFPSDCFSEAGWQMRVTEPVPASRIVSHYTVEISVMYENESLRMAVFESNKGATE